MNKRLLVSLIFLLAIDLVSTYVIEDTFSGTGEVLDEISNLEDVQERNLPKEALVHIPRLKKNTKTASLELVKKMLSRLSKQGLWNSPQMNATT